MTYTNPINPKMQVTLNAYKRKRMQVSRDLRKHYELPADFNLTPPEYFKQLEYVLSKFYVDLGYTEEQCAQMKKDLIFEVNRKRFDKLFK